MQKVRMGDRVVPLLLALALIALAQWQTDQQLTNNTAESYTTSNNAWAVAANGNTVHVVWFDNRDGNFEVYYKRSTDAGVSWGGDVQLTTTAVFALFPAVAVKGDTVHVVWQDRFDYHGEVYYLRSTNAGANWGGVTTISNVDNKLSEAPSVAVSGSDVWVVWDDSVGSGNYTISCKRSTDRGTNWGTITTVSTGYRSYYPSVAISGSYVHIVWQDDRDNDSRFAIYYDRYNGTTWKGNTNLSTKGTYHSLGPCVAAAGAYVNVLWHDYRGGKWNIYNQRSTDNGGTWKAADDYLTSNTLGYTELPNLAASSSSVWAVWDANSSGDFEIHCNNSTDYGAGWVLDRRLTYSSGCSEYPSVAFANNVVHVVWQDDRAGNYEIYYKRCVNPLNLGWFQKPASGTDFRACSWLAYNDSSGSIYAAHGYATPNPFDRYHVASDGWASRKTWYTQGAGSCACADGESIVYAALGGGSKFLYFAVYNNLWNSLTDVPSPVDAGGSCVYTRGSTTRRVLLLTGSGTSGSKSRLYAYRPDSGWTSTPRAVPPESTMYGAGSWLAYDNVNNRAYAFAATNNHLYKYDVQGDSWFTPVLASMPATPGVGGCGAFLDGRIYALRGNGTNEFYGYNVAANSWIRLENVPTPANDAMNVGDGASITTNGQDLYVEKGNSSYRLYQYVPGGAVFGPAPKPIAEGVTAQNVGDTAFVIAPNPMTSGNATLRYNLPKAGAARLSVYNVSGQSVLNRTLVVGSEASSITLDLRRLSNGVYIVKLTGDDFAGTQKLVVRR